MKDPKRDLHSEMVYEVYGEEAWEWSEEKFDQYRKRIKNVNFGRAYLRGAKSIAAMYDTKQKESKELIDNFDQRWEGVNKYHEKAKKKVSKFDKTVTTTGRVRKISLAKFGGAQDYTVYVPEWVNHEVQGTYGDGLKRARILLYQTKDQIPGNPLLVDCVHDEMVVECDKDSVKEVAEWMREYMIQGMRKILQDPELPVRVEMDYPVKNYAAVKEVEEEEGRVVV